jgi:peptidoglycan/LPS O-acetylase OafA/YrhL
MSVTPPPAPARSLRYEPCIDGWRAVAALMVLVAHFFPHRAPPNSWLQLGENGVVIFFIISGYLISSILFAAKEEVATGRVGTGGALRRFYIRRVLRIAPIYYGSILAFWLIRAPGVREGVGWHVTYTTNFAQVFWGLDFKNAGHFWTLAVEEQFYLVWPLLILAVSRARLGTVLWTVFFGSAAFVLGGAIMGLPWGVITMLPVGGASVALSFGALLAYGRFYGSGIDSRLVRASLWLGLPVFVLSQIIWTQHGGGSAVYERRDYQLAYVCSVTLFFGWLFVRSLAPGSVLGRTFSLPPLRYIGRISYGLYVYHWLLDPYYVSIWKRLGLAEPSDPVALGCWKSLTAMVIAALSWHCFEKPILGLKDRLAPNP